MKDHIFRWLKQPRFTPNCTLTPNLWTVNAFQCKAGVPRGEAYWDDNIYGNELQQNFLSRNRLTGLQTARSIQAMRKVSWWSLPLQLFGAPGSVGNKLKLYSWSCCKRFCGFLTKYYPACFQVSWITKYFEVYTATQKKESYTSLMNNGNSLQEQIAVSSWPVRSFCIQLTIKITSIKIVPAQNKEYFYLVLSRIKKKKKNQSIKCSQIKKKNPFQKTGLNQDIRALYSFLLKAPKIQNTGDYRWLSAGCRFKCLNQVSLITLRSSWLCRADKTPTTTS